MKIKHMALNSLKVLVGSAALLQLHIRITSGTLKKIPVPGPTPDHRAGISRVGGYYYFLIPDDSTM